MYLNQTYSFDGVAYSKPITILESKYKSKLNKPYTRTCILYVLEVKENPRNPPVGPG